MPLAFMKFPTSLPGKWIHSQGWRISKSQIPNNKSLAQTDLTPEVFIASTPKPEKNKGVNQASRSRAGSNKLQLSKFKIPNGTSSVLVIASAK